MAGLEYDDIEGNVAPLRDYRILPFVIKRMAVSQPYEGSAIAQIYYHPAPTDYAIQPVGFRFSLDNPQENVWEEYSTRLGKILEAREEGSVFLPRGTIYHARLSYLSRLELARKMQSFLKIGIAVMAVITTFLIGTVYYESITRSVSIPLFLIALAALLSFMIEGLRKRKLFVPPSSSKF